MNFISLNIKYLFEIQDLSEVEFGKLFGLGRGAIQSYIANKATPKIETIQKLTVKYGLTIDEFVTSDISKIIIEGKNRTKSHPEIETPNVISDPKVTLYTCPECVNKQKEIDYWKSKFYALCDDSRETERKYRELLEAKIELKKETPAESLTPAV